MLTKISCAERVCARKIDRTKLFKEKSNNQKSIIVTSDHIMQNTKFNPLHTFILHTLDKMNPVINKYPKIGQKIIKLSEKILKRANCLQ